MTYCESEFSDDPPLTPVQAGLVELLTEADLDKIDNALKAHIGNRWSKVAKIVGSALMDTKVAFPDLPDVFFA